MQCKSIKHILLRQITLLWGPIVALMLAEKLTATEAFCNCFTPMSMFKMGKHGTGSYAPPSLSGSSVYGQQVAHPGERANWYSQSQQQLSSLPAAYGQQSPIKRFNLFQPKWRSSLFGPKKWMMDWRTMGANSNFFRPTQGYGWPASVPQISNPPQAQLFPPSSIGYQYGDQQYPSSVGPYASKGSSGSYSPQLNVNDGWNALPSSNIQLPPYNSQQQQQQSANYGDSYGVLPSSSANLIQPAKQQQQSSPIDNYGTKGASGSRQPYSTTKKSVLMADGDYKFYDAHFGAGAYSPFFNSTLPSKVGYTYPEWYSGVVDSPAKTAQQLYGSQKYRDSVLAGMWK